MFRERAFSVAYYGVLGVLLALILAGSLSDVLPGSLAGQVGRNSEGLAVLLAVSVWIQFARPRLAATAREWPLTLLAAGTWATLGLMLRYGSVAPQLATLNEAALAVAVLLPYLQLRRPLPAWAWVVPVAAAAVPLIGGHNAVTTDLAEAFGALVLIPLCVDAADRGILDGSAVPLLRVLIWMAGLIVVVLLLHTFIDRTPVGFFDELIRYISRVTEMFIAGVLLHAYFSLSHPDLRLEQGLTTSAAHRAS